MKKDNYKTKEHKKLKVAAYCRVSTKQERQQFSLGYQEEYYYKLIRTWMKQIVRSEFYLIKKRGRKYLLSEECLRIKTEEIQMKSKNNIDEWISSDYVKSLLSVLDDREREVVIRHLLNGEKQNEISEDFNVTFSRVNQIYWEALEKIRSLIDK